MVAIYRADWWPRSFDCGGETAGDSRLAWNVAQSGLVNEAIINPDRKSLRDGHFHGLSLGVCISLNYLARTGKSMVPRTAHLQSDRIVSRGFLNGPI